MPGMPRRKAIEVAAIVLIGDGVVGAVWPARHVRRWEPGPTWYTRSMEWLALRPRLVVVLAVAEILAGLALASWTYSHRDSVALVAKP